MPQHPNEVMNAAILDGIFPDWHSLCTSEQAEQEFRDFKMRGAGWYLSKTDTLLVLPTHVSDLFLFLCWNRTGVGDAFGWIVNAPTREDTR